MITARYVWDITALKDGFRLHYKTSSMWKMVWLGSLVIIAIGAYESVTARDWSHGLPLLVFGVAFPLIARPAIFRQFRRTIRRAPSYGSEITYTFDPEQIMISGEGFHSTFTWKKLYSATVSEKGVLLYTQKILFHWVPVTGFAAPSDIATVSSYLDQNGVRTRNV
jgi:hypothetical protein